MKQSTKRLASSFLSLLFLIAAFFVFFNFVQPAYSSLERVRSDEFARRTFLERQQSAIEGVKKLIATYEGEGDLRELVSRVLPLHPDLAGALAQLNELALQNQLDPQSFSVSAPVMQPPARETAGQSAGLVKPYSFLNIQLLLVGSYSDFKAFLAQLETNERIFDAKRISLQPAGRPTQDLYAYTLPVTTYYQNP